MRWSRMRWRRNHEQRCQARRSLSAHSAAAGFSPRGCTRVRSYIFHLWHGGVAGIWATADFGLPAPPRKKRRMGRCRHDCGLFPVFCLNCLASDWWPESPYSALTCKKANGKANGVKGEWGQALGFGVDAKANGVRPWGLGLTIGADLVCCRAWRDHCDWNPKTGCITS